MKFVDSVRIEVKAGDGGNGAIAFRREKYIERGGPSGGDGGNGGSVIFEADPQLTTLLDYRYQQHHRAKNGENGMGSDMNGRASDDLVLRVPVGTLIKDAATEELLCDLSQPGQRFVAAQGGRGGLGNMNFATSTRQAPRFAQDGTKGEERILTLELKLLADVGLLGFPNAGKSTLISRVSRARPKIADYPFTTLVPNLGMVQYKDSLSFVMADIPGLIEGASEGTGLGHQFLRHVERCRVLIHMVDLSAPGEDRAPLKDFEVINRELERYSPELAQKPQVVCATKMDLPDAKEKLPEFEAAMAERGLKVFPLSAATGEGLQQLLDVTAQVLFGGPHAAEALHVPVVKRKATKTKAKPAAQATQLELYEGLTDAQLEALTAPDATVRTRADERKKAAKVAAALQAKTMKAAAASKGRASAATRPAKVRAKRPVKPAKPVSAARAKALAAAKSKAKPKWAAKAKPAKPVRRAVVSKRKTTVKVTARPKPKAKLKAQVKRVVAAVKRRVTAKRPARKPAGKSRR